MDLTKITTPFGLLDAKTQKALKDACANGLAIEGYNGEWRPRFEPEWWSGTAYRVKPEPEETTVWVNVWKGVQGEVYHLAWDEKGRADMDATESCGRHLLARKTTTIKHGVGL